MEYRKQDIGAVYRLQREVLQNRTAYRPECIKTSEDAQRLEKEGTNNSRH